MPIPDRVFLGWDQPPLESAARWLLLTHPARDLSGFTLVLPSRRAGRLFRAILLEVARESPGEPLSPPFLLTPGELGDALVRPDHGVSAPAGPGVRRLAWIHALREAGSAALGRILRVPPDMGDTLGLSRLAALFENWSSQVASTGRRLADVPEAGAGLPDFADADRWLAAGQVQDLYEEHLRAQGLHDPDLAMIGLVAGLARRDVLGSVPGGAPLVLVGVVELSPLLRSALEHAGRPITALIAAPESLADAFDGLGCLDPDAWGDRPVDLSSARIEFLDSPHDQAEAVLDAIEALGGAYSAEQIVVGVPDPQIEPLLETAGRRTQAGPSDAVTASFRPSAGRPLAQTPPVVFLRAVREYLASGTVEAFSALVRHPDLETCLLRERDERGPAGSAGSDGVSTRTPRRALRVEDWLGTLDALACESLADSVRSPWRGGTPGQRAALDELREWVDGLLAPLRGAGARPVGAIARDLVAVLARLYTGRTLTLENPVHAQTIEACDRLRDMALDLAMASVSLVPAETLQIMLDALGDGAIPAPPARDAVELVGWLELPLDPAPVTILTGLNEGVLPSRPAPDPMLPDRLRAALGLSSSASRRARDAYLLNVIARSRERLVLLAGRRAAEGDPLMPSRLLFACDDRAAAERLAAFASEHATHPRAAFAPASGVRTSASVPVWGQCPVLEDQALPDALPVTAFAFYLRSPYEFYLRFIQRAHQVEEPEVELPGSAFGTLLHGVLAGLAATDVGASDDAGRVAQALSDLLASAARERLGPSPRPALRAQVEAARLRLAEFAVHQARWASQGWRILHTERRVERGVARLMVDGVPMGLTGSIDRIDRHEDGRLAIIDYKAGEDPKTPEAAHRRGRGEARMWIDLQLPLYRHLAMPLLGVGASASVLAYARLGADTDLIGFEAAEWTQDDLASADKAAFDVVRAIRRRRFEIPGEFAQDRVVAALCADAEGRARARRRVGLDAVLASPGAGGQP